MAVFYLQKGAFLKPFSPPKIKPPLQVGIRFPFGRSQIQLVTALPTGAVTIAGEALTIGGEVLTIGG